ncbi:hypothetical protein HELRODRAFT_110736 [Helobdella robusta]|uniref:Protein kinase domain-containing protein n=1 Tax=Helobdella robusta TaxID=6412 RepID=T1EF48_HELRO|nr:hypothetical protein HELRODRAFT_110736 [Helobdella robusta]ESO07228.1 hypothetical protein HELRODRAFT_110736 [Helobdella robusta]
MAFLDKLKNFKIFGYDDRRKTTRFLKHVTYSRNPNDCWQIVKEIGDGAFGKVFLTKNVRTQEESALKQVAIMDDNSIDDHSVEINILSEIKHPSIVHLKETYFFDDKLWMYLEYCSAGALDAIMLNLEKPLTEPQISCVCADVCKGLECLHDNFVIHRDLKASNLLLTADGRIKIADFGVSAKNESAKKMRDSFIGTPYWLMLMAPEVMRCETLKDVPYGYKADVWSLGITLIECAEMHPPYHDMHPMRVLIKIAKSDPPTLKKPSEWSRFNDFLAKCLVKDPDYRSSSFQLVQHPFISTTNDWSPMRQLLAEINAEVTEEVREEPDETSLDVCLCVCVCVRA